MKNGNSRDRGREVGKHALCLRLRVREQELGETEADTFMCFPCVVLWKWDSRSQFQARPGQNWSLSSPAPTLSLISIPLKVERSPTGPRMPFLPPEFSACYGIVWGQKEKYKKLKLSHRLQMPGKKS